MQVPQGGDHAPDTPGYRILQLCALPLGHHAANVKGSMAGPPPQPRYVRRILSRTIKSLRICGQRSISRQGAEQFG